MSFLDLFVQLFSAKQVYFLQYSIKHLLVQLTLHQIGEEDLFPSSLQAAGEAAYHEYLGLQCPRQIHF